MKRFDTENQLEILAKSFHGVGKTILSVYDSSRGIICSYPHKMCDFCHMVRQNKTLQERCIAHDLAAFDVCDKTKSLYKYHCHMGLVEVAEPIVKDGIILGYLLFGQITDQKDRTEIIENAKLTADEFSLDKDELTDAASRIKYRNDEYIASISIMLEMGASYILMNNILSVRTGSLAFGISEYIKANLAGDLTIEALCEQFYISRSTLYNISSRFYGCGISDYIVSLRIGKAKNLLSGCDLPVYEIAAAIGIADGNYFTKVFKKITGMTPKSYQLSKSKKL